MSAITTHVLDTARGRPASGIHVDLEISEGAGSWRRIGHGATDGDGRLRTLMPEGEPLTAGIYRLVFDVQRYFAGRSGCEGEEGNAGVLVSGQYRRSSGADFFCAPIT